MAARYGRRIRAMRRGAAGTAVAALAVAALSASQAPGFAQAERARSAVPKPPPGPQIDGGSPFYSALPPEDGSSGLAVGGTSGPTPTGGTGTSIDTGGTGLPGTVLDAYRRAQLAIATSDQGCKLPWELLAAIGQVESGQASGGAVDAKGTTYKPILGPVLNGAGFANISDTDGGAYDGDTVHDRAVGPMQFIPSTWASWGADGNADGVKDPNNIYDAALAAGHYLCADNRDLSVSADIDRAILGYNHSQDYLHTVRAWFQHFKDQGAVAVPDSGRTPGTGTGPTTPPATTAPKPGARPSATATGSVSPAPTTTGRPTPPTTGPGTPTGTPTGTASPSPTPTPTGSGSPTPGCPTPTPTPTGSASPTPTPTGTPTPAPTPTPTDGSCPTPTPTTSPTPSPTATGATTAPASPSAAPSTSPAAVAG
ncbi:lytic transglycosylase domain-containing protein [Streptomyces sp. RKAG337]|uniref:lytic transglycosylase domain-containing protein n=1 Tax=Streptomyces sp. RKAG337 TaxID=2893404 RepID=UPI0020337386|nr:lytic transglycosylase domain-containing protein [Streptomyces sp. RKAG337]MCM2429055.1 lytic transglycosylase domain-containing protein [Streptomyces sp. RKAG337]